MEIREGREIGQRGFRACRRGVRRFRARRRDIDFLFQFLSGEVKIDEQFCVFDTVNYWGLENRRRVVLGETSSYAMIR